MKILLMLLLLGCEYNPDGLKYGDRVEITDGLYRERSGVILDSTSSILPCQHKFTVEIDSVELFDKYQFISVCDLELSKD